MLDSVCFINLITESEKDGIHNLSQLGLGRMIFDPVDGLSSDEAGPEGEAKPPPQTRRRRIRRRKEQKEDDRSFQKLVQDPNGAFHQAFQALRLQTEDLRQSVFG